MDKVDLRPTPESVLNTSLTIPFVPGIEWDIVGWACGTTPGGDRHVQHHLDRGASLPSYLICRVPQSDNVLPVLAQE
jgi:hypothetical protein